VRFRIQVFAKAPVPGQVKTRLVPRLGAAGAAALHTPLLEHALHTAASAHVGGLELWCAPDDAHPFLRDCARRFGAKLNVQSPGDLGQRMLDAISTASLEGHAAILMGSDCPGLQPADLQAAATALRCGHDAAFVPAEDGGYVLIAARRAPAALFEGIAWGGPQVMAQTRERLSHLRWAWHEVTPRWDVDRPEDYDRLLREGWLHAEDAR
jgi:rSAM/selenodomain-associated transferase 1